MPGYGYFSHFEVGSYILFPTFIIKVNSTMDNIITFQSVLASKTLPPLTMLNLVLQILQPPGKPLSFPMTHPLQRLCLLLNTLTTSPRKILHMPHHSCCPRSSCHPFIIIQHYFLTYLQLIHQHLENTEPSLTLSNYIIFLVAAVSQTKAIFLLQAKMLNF